METTTRKLPAPPIWLNPNLVPDDVRARVHDLADETAALIPQVRDVARRARLALDELETHTSLITIDDADAVIAGYTGYELLHAALMEIAEMCDAAADADTSRYHFLGLDESAR